MFTDVDFGALVGFLAFGGVVIIGLVPVEAHANAAEPAWYGSDVSGSTVEICAEGNLPHRCDAPDAERLVDHDECPGSGIEFGFDDGSSEIVCDGSDGMSHEMRRLYLRSALIRENVETGEIVFVSGLDCDDRCFVDECVEEGTYRYGYRKPFSCGACASVEYYTEVTVEASPADDCAPNSTEIYDGEAPWTGEDQIKSRYSLGPDIGGDDESLFGGSLTVAAVIIFNLLVFGGGVFVYRRRRKST